MKFRLITLALSMLATQSWLLSKEALICFQDSTIDVCEIQCQYGNRCEESFRLLNENPEKPADGACIFYFPYLPNPTLELLAKTSSTSEWSKSPTNDPYIILHQRPQLKDAIYQFAVHNGQRKPELCEALLPLLWKVGYSPANTFLLEHSIGKRSTSQFIHHGITQGQDLESYVFPVSYGSDGDIYSRLAIEKGYHYVYNPQGDGNCGPNAFLLILAYILEHHKTDPGVLGMELEEELAKYLQVTPREANVLEGLQILLGWARRGITVSEFIRNFQHRPYYLALTRGIRAFGSHLIEKYSWPLDAKRFYLPYTTTGAEYKHLATFLKINLKELNSLSWDGSRKIDENEAMPSSREFQDLELALYTHDMHYYVLAREKLESDTFTDHYELIADAQDEVQNFGTQRLTVPTTFIPAELMRIANKYFPKTDGGYYESHEVCQFFAEIYREGRYGFTVNLQYAEILEKLSR